MGTDRLTTYRRISQVAFILLVFLLPVLDILRIDTDTHELILFGTSWSFGIEPVQFGEKTASSAFQIALQILLKGILPWLLVLAIFPLLGFFTSRLFCGWACPEGALFELSDFLTLKLLGRRDLFQAHQSDPPQAARMRLWYGSIAQLSAVFIPLAGGVALTGYFVAPTTIWHQIASWQFTFGVKAGIIGVAIYMLITSARAACSLPVHLCCRPDANALRLDQPGVAPAQHGCRAHFLVHGLQRLRSGLFHERDAPQPQTGHFLRELRRLHRGLQQGTGRRQRSVPSRIRLRLRSSDEQLQQDAAAGNGTHRILIILARPVDYRTARLSEKENHHGNNRSQEHHEVLP